MMFDIGGGVPNAANIMTVVGGTGSSQRHMFQEISYGIQDTQPEYFGPYKLPVNNCLTIACCGPSSDKTGNGATVQMQMDALGQDVQSLLLGLRHDPVGRELRDLGRRRIAEPDRGYSSYSFHQIVGYAQEIGHNFGMTHEPTMCCGGTVSGNRTCSGGVTFSDNTAHCQHMEYAQLALLHGRRRAPPVGGPQVPPGLDERLQPGQGRHRARRSRCCRRSCPATAPSCCRFPAPKTRPGPGIRGDGQGNPPMLTHYYLEMRAPLGFDSGMGPMVLVSIGPDLPAANRNAPYVYLLDTNPSRRRSTTRGCARGPATPIRPAG